MHVHQFWWVWAFRFWRYCYLQTWPNFFHFLTMDYSPWVSKKFNQLELAQKKLMQVGVDLKCMLYQFWWVWAFRFRRYLIPPNLAQISLSDLGCTPPGGGSRICASANMRVTITCSANAADGYTITGPGGASSTYQSLSFTVTSGSYGNYVCRSSNPCGDAVSTIRLESAACKFLN